MKSFDLLYKHRMLPRISRQFAKNRGETEWGENERPALKFMMRYGNYCFK